MNKEKETTQAVSTSPAQEPEINEVDGKPIYHADEEEGTPAKSTIRALWSRATMRAPWSGPCT